MECRASVSATSVNRAAAPPAKMSWPAPPLPPEVVELILRRADGRTVASCRRVCTTWKHIVDRLHKEQDLWKNFCLKDFPDAWGSVSEKGDLSWPDLYINICLWSRIKYACVKKELLQFFTDIDKQIITLSMSKEGSLNVTLRNSIILYDIYTLRPTREISGQYFCYFENKYVKMLHSDDHTLFFTSDTQESVSISNVYLFRVIDNICYYITLRQELFMYNLEQSVNCKKKALLVKWYNSDMIIALDYHKSKVYLLTNSGKILTYERSRLVKLRDVKWPQNSKLYRKFYLFRGNIFFYCDYANFHISLASNKEVTYTELYVRCISLHGNILIIGTYFGQISLYLIKDVEDLLILDKIPPISSHLLCVDCPISGIDILEESGCHTIFAWTASNVFMIKYDHLSINFGENLLCNRFSVCSIIQCSESNSDYNALISSSTETV